MAAVVSAAEVPPGGEGKIEVKVATHGRKGELTKTVTVYSNDPKTPQFMLKLTGTVEVIAAFEPSSLNLKNVLKNTSVTETVKLIAKEPQKLKISDIVSSKPENISAEMVEQEGAPAMKITFKAGDKPERISARITAKTNLENPKELSLSIFGQVSDDLIADRSSVFFVDPPALSDGVSTKTFSVLASVLKDKRRIVTLKISSISSKPFQVTEIQDPGSNVIGSAQPIDNGWQVTLLLVRTPAQPRGTIKILTDREDQKALEVSYNTRAAIKNFPHPTGKFMPSMQPVGPTQTMGEIKNPPANNLKIDQDARKIPLIIKDEKLIPPRRLNQPGQQPNQP